MSLDSKVLGITGLRYVTPPLYFKDKSRVHCYVVANRLTMFKLYENANIKCQISNKNSAEHNRHQISFSRTLVIPVINFG